MGAKAIYTDMRERIINDIVIADDVEAIAALLRDREEFYKFVGGWQNVVLPDTMTQVLDIIRIVSEKQSASFYGFKLVPSDTDAKLSFRTDSFDLFALKDHFDIITGLNITPIDEHFIVELRIADLYMASR